MSVLRNLCQDTCITTVGHDRCITTVEYLDWNVPRKKGALPPTAGLRNWRFSG